MRRLALVLAALACVQVAAAQTYPVRPIKLIVPFAPGGPADVIGRILGQQLGQGLGQSIVIENRGGAGGTIGARAAAAAEADGYTLMFANTSTLSINTAVYTRLDYDPLKAFAPVALIGTTSNIMVVNPAPAGKVGRRAHRLWQGQSRQARLFDARHRHAAAYDRRIVQAAHRPRHHPCPL
jgi:tripartite-type tricarboxylate transporter receptor subunit TctC